MEMQWIDDRLPEKPGNYLVTVWGDSIVENYVIPAKYSCKPWHGQNAFFYGNKDITEFVIAWIRFPKAYDLSSKPILSDDEDDWIDHHM